MPISDSPLAGGLVIACGARRSGTHLLQRLLMAHPEIGGVPGETYLFSDGMRPLFDRFQYAAKGSAQTGKIYAERAVVLDAARDLCDRLLLPFREPGQRLVSERTPAHVSHLDLIADLYPDASVIHIIRDGRDAARSLISMDWGPETVEEAAAEWRDSVTAGRTSRKPARYREIRYEELVAGPEAVLSDLYAWLGVDASPEAVAQGVREAGVHENVDPGSDLVALQKWRTAFTVEELARFETVAGELRAELGYPPSDGSDGEAAGRAAAPAGAAKQRRRLRLPLPRRGPELSDEAFQRRFISRMQWTNHIGDRFVGALRTADRATIDEIAADRLEVRVVGADGTVTEAAGVPALMDAIAADPAFGAPQAWSEVHPTLPEMSIVMGLDLPDGTRALRAVYVGLSGLERVGSVTIHRLTA